MAAEPDQKDMTPVVAPASDGVGSFIKRELSGATFLTLEHIGHMALVVVVTVLMAAGIVTALSLWTGATGIVSMLPMAGALGAKYLAASMAIGVVAALLVLVPMLVVFDSRTRAEWLKRPGYAGRLAYKVPVYTALGLLVAGKTVAVIQMVGVVLMSLALIGVGNAGIGDMYMSQFVPATIAAIIFGSSAWYVFKLAKGRDSGKLFSMVMIMAGMVLAIALFITAIITFHASSDSINPMRSNDYFNNYNNPDSTKNLNDLFKY